MRNAVVINGNDLDKGAIMAPYNVSDALWNQGIEVYSRHTISHIIDFINDINIYETEEDKIKVHENTHEHGYTKLIDIDTLYIYESISGVSLFIERIEDNKFLFKSKEKIFSIYLRY